MKFQVMVRATLVATIAMVSTFSLSAQTQPAPSGKPKMSREEHQQKRQDDMATQLNLSPEQKAKFAETDKKYDEKMKSEHADNKKDMEKLRADREKAHRSQLTKEQAAKYDQILSDRKAKHEAHKDKKGHGKGKGKKAEGTPAPGTHERN